MMKSLLAACVIAFATSKRTISSDSITAEFSGGGDMRVYPKSLPNYYIRVKQEKLEEVTVEGDTPSGSGSSSLNINDDSEWSDFQLSGDVSTTSFTAAEEGVSFKLTAHFTDVTSTVDEVVPCSGNATDLTTVCTESVTVNSNELKFSIQVSGWKFRDMSNKLEYDLEIRVKSTLEDDDGDDSDEDEDEVSDDVELVEGEDDDSKKLASKAGLVRMPTVAYIKGGESDEEVNVQINKEVKDEKIFLNFVFPAFPAGTTLYYDPDIVLSQPNSDSSDVNSGAIHFFSPTSIACVLAAFFGSKLLY